MYDFNQAYEGFVSRFGIEPNGVLMSEETYEILKQPMESFIIAIKEPATFRGIPIMRSKQMEPNQIRFVI